jgi:uncharacterized coiled-coil protein SlyX
LSEQDEATDNTVPTPQKRKPGRPKKVTTENTDVAELRRMVANLQDALLQQGAERFDKQQATLAAVPPPSEELKPGSYVEIGKDSSGAPVIGKVRWTRAWVERTYGPVTFTPMRSMTINPHGISYRVEAETETTVPSIVKSIYDEVIRGERAVQASTKPLSAQETSNIDAQANEAPGPHWSRLYRTSGGLNVNGPEAEPAEAK